MALSSIRLTDIPEEGLRVSCDVQPDEIALAGSDAKVQGALSVGADLAKIGKLVSITGSVEGTFLRECVRCLKEYETFVTVPFTVEYHPQESPEARSERSDRGPERQDRETDQNGRDADETDDPGDEDLYEYTSDCVELGPMLREQVIPAIPMQPLCREDCLGLCPVCGQDRNERRCDCPEQAEPSPFSALRQLRDDLREAQRSKSDPQRNRGSHAES